MPKCPECGFMWNVTDGALNIPVPEELFDLFWQIYPSRNGKKLEKKATLKAFLLIDKKDWSLVVKATQNYANSTDVKAGIGIKDPKRFLKNDFWKEWIVPEPVAPEKEKTQYEKDVEAGL